MPKPTPPHDTPEQQAACQNCEKPICTNCVAYKHILSRPDIDSDRLLQLYEAGYTPKEMAGRTEYSIPDINKWHYANGLKGNTKRRGRYATNLKGINAGRMQSRDTVKEKAASDTDISKTAGLRKYSPLLYSGKGRKVNT